jgi:capsular exopolysaccharide synthesis family protein
VDVRTFVEIIRARWKIVIAAIAACLLGAMAITALQTKNYQSSATVLMSFSGATSISEFFEATQTSEQRLSSYAEIAGGRTVAQRAIEQLGLPMSADELVKKTKITYTPESLLFRVTVVDTDPRRAAALTGAIAQQFAEYVPTVEMTSGPQQPIAAAKATVVDQPVVAERPSSPVPGRNIAVGLVAGVLLGIAVALARDATDRTIRNRKTVEKVTGLPTLAQLTRPKSRDPIARHGSEQHADLTFEGAVRRFRSRLLGQASGVRTVLLVSSALGEGVTTTAFSLAMSLADVDDNVLLVEGDPRQATIAKMADVESTAGLADVLAEREALDDAVHPTSYPDLWVLASNTAAAPEHHFGTAVLPATLEKVSANFEHVIIDGPPALATIDAGLLAAAADATVLVVRAGHSRVDEVEAALDNLRAAGGNVIGTVLTGAGLSRPTKAATRVYQQKVGKLA